MLRISQGPTRGPNGDSSKHGFVWTMKCRRQLPHCVEFYPSPISTDYYGLVRININVQITPLEWFHEGGKVD